MVRIVTAAAVIFVALAQVSVVRQAFGQQGVAPGEPIPGTSPAVKTQSAVKNLADVPPLPKGKSTIMGGRIRNIDQVKDQFVLNVYGQKPVKIRYDARTQMFKDGKKIPPQELSPAEHASVQTTLDGDKIFALSVHILTGAPEGDFQGRINSYDATSGMLMIAGSSGQAPFTVRVTPNTTVSREGQGSFTSAGRGQGDLVSGSLVSMTFEPDSKGHGIAKSITILATPGAKFVFSGVVTALNVSSGYLVLTDPRDERTYQIHFNPADAPAQKLRQGDKVRITADYDGTRYAATDIAASNEP